MLTRKQLAIVHVAKAKTGMTDEEYRDLLSGRFGVESSKNLNLAQLDELLYHFGTLGFKNRSKRRYTKPAENKKRLAAKITAIQAAMGLNDTYVNSMAKRMFRVDEWIWCEPAQMHKLVAALTYHQKRTEARDADK